MARRASGAPQRRPTRRYIKRHGLAVQRGPWQGLVYDRVVAKVANDVAAKLIGSYEEELHDALAAAVAARPRTFLDVGCAEGYHAVGAARALSGARVVAYDNDVVARRLCARLARANGVEDRVEIRSTFELGEAASAERPLLLLMDCEGCEVMLLHDEATGILGDSTVLVELHDFAAPGIEERLAETFAGSHSVDIIRAAGRYRNEYEELHRMPRLSDVQLDLLLTERRPTHMSWAVMQPRAA